MKYKKCEKEFKRRIEEFEEVVAHVNDLKDAYQEDKSHLL